MITYEEFVEPHKNRYLLISISEEKSKIIKSFVKEVIKKKETEEHHKIDKNNEFKRWYSGISGEAAVEALFQRRFINFNIGESKKFHTPDLSPIGVNVGVKTVEYGKFPIIFKKSTKPEIIVLKQDDLNFYICGLATVDILNQNQSDDLILSPSLKRRGTKSGFYGFNKLKKFSTLEELKDLF